MPGAPALRSRHYLEFFCILNCTFSDDDFMEKYEQKEVLLIL